ncbi:MAG: glycosyltransferase family 2 protein [Bacteroidales bacterium]
MFLSVLIPVYNTSEWIDNCLTSILSQNISPDCYEIIVVNDGSTDNSAAILDRYTSAYSNVKVFTQENKGLSAARNAALKQASGEYVLFVDSDDWLFPASLGELRRKAEVLRSDIISFGAYSIYPDGSEVLFTGDIHSGLINVSGTEYLNTLNLCGGVWRMLFNRSFLLKQNLWMKEGIYCEDELFLPMAFVLAETVSVVDLKVYAYRRHADSITTKRSREHLTRLLNDRIFVAGELKQYSLSLTGEKKQALQYKISLLTVDVILNCYIGNYSKAERKQAIDALTKKGLYPLPAQNRTMKYDLFRIVVNNPFLYSVFDTLQQVKIYIAKSFSKRT